jgi:hypothetical protein
MKFKVWYEVIQTSYVLVDAGSKGEAEHKAKEQYHEKVAVDIKQELLFTEQI